MNIIVVSVSVTPSNYPVVQFEHKLFGRTMDTVRILVKRTARKKIELMGFLVALVATVAKSVSSAKEQS